MLGGLTGFNQSPNADFGERMLNSVASQSIRHLFTSSDTVEVEIRCSPASKLLQGSIDSFKMQGKGLVIRREFETKEMSFETDAVAIDVGALLGGKIRLRQPTQAIAQVVLSEAAINRAFEAELVQKQLTNVTHEEITNLSGGEPVSFRDVRLKLKPNQQVEIWALTDLPNRKDVPISLSAQVTVEKRRRILFANAQFEPGEVPSEVQGLSKVLTQGFIKVLNGMVDLERFNLDGVMLRVNRLETKGSDLVFSGYAQVEHFPGTR
ncbi:LmeA family phospholipid-binding protein [Almyronema epifaneia]|uniref:LmeA family phospholipid-binding protein n=1 Tax=Almyronema epifaneia TaxID=3114805 RepID=UPI00366E182A